MTYVKLITSKIKLFFTITVINQLVLNTIKSIRIFIKVIQIKFQFNINDMGYGLGFSFSVPIKYQFYKPVITSSGSHCIMCLWEGGRYFEMQISFRVWAHETLPKTTRAGPRFVTLKFTTLTSSLSFSHVLHVCLSLVSFSFYLSLSYSHHSLTCMIYMRM